MNSISHVERSSTYDYQINNDAFLYIVYIIFRRQWSQFQLRQWSQFPGCRTLFYLWPTFSRLELHRPRRLRVFATSSSYASIHAHFSFIHTRNDRSARRFSFTRYANTLQRTTTICLVRETRYIRLTYKLFSYSLLVAGRYDRSTRSKENRSEMLRVTVERSQCKAWKKNKKKKERREKVYKRKEQRSDDSLF